jgi:hypothetical protein
VYVTGAGQTSIVTGVFDSDAKQTVIRRLNLLGAHALAISRDH